MQEDFPRGSFFPAGENTSPVIFLGCIISAGAVKDTIELIRKFLQTTHLQPQLPAAHSAELCLLEIIIFI